MLKLALVGDIAVHGRHAVSLARDPQGFMAPTRPLLARADVVLGNLEIPVVPEASDAHEPATGSMPRQAAAHLRQWGFTHLSLANNHIMDLGEKGLEATIGALGDAGIVSFGAAPGEDEAYRPVRLQTDPPAALLAYAMTCRANVGAERGGSARFSVRRATEAIRSLRHEGRLVIVTYHIGRMYLRRPAPAHLAAVRTLLEAGANVVACHHSHVPAGILQHNRRVAALGLGDFLFDPHMGEIRTMVGRRSRKLGVCLEVDVEPEGVTAVRRHALELSPDRGPVPAARGAAIEARWRRWDHELSMDPRAYALYYHLVEYPRLFAYLGNAALIRASRGEWRQAYGATLGLIVSRLRRRVP